MKFKQKKFFWRKNPTQRKTAALTPINSWYCLPIKVSKNTLQAGFDTGAPTTLIDRKFFNDHRSLFRNVREQGGVAFAQLARPLTIQGQKFQDVDVVISDLKGSLGNNTPDAFLGLNVIRQKNWIVDFKNLTFSVY